MLKHTALATTLATTSPGRYRPELHPEAPQRQAKPKREKQPEAAHYYSFPYAVFKAPPIRHRNGTAEDGLTVFEFVVAAAIGQLIRLERGKERHELAFQDGGKVIGKARPALDRAKEVRKQHPFWKTKTQHDGGARFPNEVHQTYAATRAEVLKAQAIEPLLDIKVTHAELLRAMALPYKGTNRADLPTALRRLTQPVGKFPPVLRECEELDDGRLRLCANDSGEPLHRDTGTTANQRRDCVGALSILPWCRHAGGKQYHYGR
jgi:hypothetical protein